MVRIRLKRQGRKHRPFYRIVVTDIRSRRDGAPKAVLGFYDPIRKQLRLDKQAAEEWLSKGAQATEAVQRLIGKADGSNELQQLMAEKKQKLSKKAAEKAQSTEAEAQAAAETAAVPQETPAAETAEEPAAEESAPAAEEPAKEEEAPAEA